MSHHRAFLNLASVFQFVAVAVLGGACYTTRTLQPARLAVTPAVPRVRLTQADRSVTVESPRVSGDTLRGLVQGVQAQFLLSPGSVIQVRRPAPVRTAALVLLGGGAIVAGAALLGTSGPSNPCQPICPVRPGCPAYPCPSFPFPIRAE
jgi:hypothetical protein